MRGFTLTLLALCYTCIVTAQLSTGIKLGLVAGTPIGKAEAGATGAPGIGALAGVLGEYQLTEKWKIGAEMYYTHKKSTFATPAEVDEYRYLFHPPGTDTMVWITAQFVGDVDGQFNNRYLEVPVVGHYALSNKFGLSFGPYVAYLLEGEISGTSNGEVTIGVGTAPIEQEDFDESQHLEKLDYGLVGGLRYQTNFGLIYEFRLTSGLRSVFKDSYPLADGVVRNVYAQLTAGYKFGKSVGKDF